MAKLKGIVDELVTANRILADQGIVDSFGHVSVRHPKDDKLYLLSRARAPELVEARDIVAYALDGEPAHPKKTKGLAPYIERFIHGAIYEGAARRAVRGAQPFAEHDPVRRHRQSAEAGTAYVRLDRP
ncbi:MAG: class II aldolase/adducin family protein [Methyloceanibacter sp.]